MIGANEINQMFAGIDPATVQIIAKDNREALSKSIVAVSKYLADAKLDIGQLSPKPELIMNAFRLCPISSTRVCIIGQDPYINTDEANGCSFSTYRAKIPPSLAEIYKCLHYTRMITDIPTHGNLDSWAQQGILLLNTALTTILKKSNAHTALWKKYTTDVVTAIANARPQCVFVLFGGHAQKLKKVLPKSQVCFTWCHPLPVNTTNKDKTNPLRFENCPIFAQINTLLGSRNERVINWNLPEQLVKLPVVIPNSTPRLNQCPHTIYLFTDGGARANGKVNCRASYGYCIYANEKPIIDEFGIVAPVDIKGKVFKSSNNRGELSAIMFGLEHLVRNIAEYNGMFDNIIIISDSEYSINSINTFYPKWITDPVKHELSEKMNVDLIGNAHTNLTQLRKHMPVKFTHVRSHKVAPPEGTFEWFVWNGNDRVDKLCQKPF